LPVSRVFIIPDNVQCHALIKGNLLPCALCYYYKLANYAEAATVADHANENVMHENSEITEKPVLALCLNQLKVNVTPADISVAHRLGKPRQRQQGTNVSSGPPPPPPIIVRFTNRKARDQARRK